MLLRPNSARNRFVKYAKNTKGQREKNDKGRNKIVAVSQKFPGKGSGFDPQKEVFGLVFDNAGNWKTHACLVLDAWGAYLSYNKAASMFENVKHAENQLPIYRIGTRDTEDGNRKAVTFNGFSTVDIEALDIHSPMFYQIYEQGQLRDEDPAEVREYLEWSGWWEIYQSRRQRYEQAIGLRLQAVSIPTSLIDLHVSRLPIPA